jgi:hypothetical protein
MFETSDSTDKIFGALAKAQGTMSNPVKDRTVKVASRSGGATYEFAYATLSQIIDTIRKPLSENGICFTQSLVREEGKLVLRTRLGHDSGQWIASTLPVEPRENSAQALGSAITYVKRYALAAICGLAADEDDDGAAAEMLAAQKAPKMRAQRQPDAPVVEPSGDRATWVRKFLERAAACKTAEDLAAFEKANEKSVATFRADAPEKWSAHFDDRMAEIRKAFDDKDKPDAG